MGSVTMRRFIVLRNCPPDMKGQEGRWYSWNRVLEGVSWPLDHGGAVTFGPTGRFETGEDGEQAEVFEPEEKE